jgi:hypothetical protein
MLKPANVKMYRKLMILAVLSGSLFAFSSLNTISAIPCCSPRYAACDVAHDSCVANCNMYLGIPAKYAQCVDLCDKGLLACQANAEPCDHGC